MRYYQRNGGESLRLAVRTDDTVYDLTAVNEDVRTFTDLLDASSVSEQSIEGFTEELLEDAPESTEDLSSQEVSPPPLEATEVWAAGVTYQISEEAREAESSMPDMYLDVYNSERPEVFFKSTPERTVGPNDGVGIRADSKWDVPEPELGIVLYRGEVVGYTIGNDMSSRSIEGENPLYLPQAKVYDRCCSLGPCVTAASAIDDPHDLEMSMTISRNGEILYEDATTTGEMVRTVDELVEYYLRHNRVPDVSVLLTGTSLVPDDSFTLESGDLVEISIEEIGTLTNSVVDV